MKQNPSKKEPAADSPAAMILGVEPSIDVDFTIRRGSNKPKAKPIARFPENPEKNWGPKRKATGKRKAESTSAQEQEQATKRASSTTDET